MKIIYKDNVYKCPICENKIILTGLFYNPSQGCYVKYCPECDTELEISKTEYVNDNKLKGESA